MLLTVELVVDGGVAALHRVATVLAHQRADVRRLVMVAGDGATAPARFTLDLEGSDAALDQVVKRLRRGHCVREARAVVAGQAAEPSP